MAADTSKPIGRPAPIGAISLAEEIRDGMEDVAVLSRGGVRGEVKLGRDSLWVFLRWKDGPEFALRTAWSQGGGLKVRSRAFVEEAGSVELDSPMGVFEVKVGLSKEEEILAHSTVTLTPAQDLLIPFWPRDLYPLGHDGTPLSAEGEVLAGQRGFNAPIIYLKTSAGAALYFQNLTALNDFSNLTKSKPDGVVGGKWPELGYQPATAPKAPSPPEYPLPANCKVVISDWILQATSETPEGEAEQAKRFINWLSKAYQRTAVGETDFRNWPQRAEQTLRHLGSAKAATQTFYGHRFVRPYLEAEPPDSMAQLAVLHPLTEYARWKGSESKLLRDLRGGVNDFWDEEVGFYGRFLANVGEEKERYKIDSWYLYHPLTKLGRLALDGDVHARKLFFDALPYAMRVARKFAYCWPVFFDGKSLKVIQQKRQENQPGQSDVGGVYAYVMVQAYELTKKKSYLEEAAKALRALEGHGFEIEYQANLIAHGAVACLKYWRETGDASFIDTSYYLLASFFHNSIFWESDIDCAQHYSVLLGASCLHNGPYMAMYECWEACILFSEYLSLGEDEIDEEAHFLMSEYCRRTLHRAWFYYPEELPEDVVCESSRSGKIDRKLAFPLEDLYAGGDKPGTVGQEVYGCGAAFAFTAYAFKRPDKAKFLVSSQHPFLAFEQAGERQATFRLAGREGCEGPVRIFSDDGGATKVMLKADDGAELRATNVDGGVEIIAPLRRSLTLTWSH